MKEDNKVSDDWQYDYDFLLSLKEKVNNQEFGDGLGMEEIEAVLIALDYTPLAVDNKDRPKIKDFFGPDVNVLILNDIFLEQPQLYLYIQALDSYIDELETTPVNNTTKESAEEAAEKNSMKTAEDIRNSFVRSCVEGYQDAKINGKKVENFHGLVNMGQLKEWCEYLAQSNSEAASNQWRITNILNESNNKVDGWAEKLNEELRKIYDDYSNYFPLRYSRRIADLLYNYQTKDITQPSPKQ